VRKLTREQAIAVGALCLFVLACVGVVAWSFSVRMGAAQELSDREEQLARLDAGARSKRGAHGPVKATAAPAAAFLDAPTGGVAGASLQAYVARLAGQHATLVSFAVQSTTGTESGDAVRVEASMDIKLSALQMLLYELESGTPYVFVESMTVRPTASAQAGAPDAPLRVTLGLRALWRRPAA
jgi:general secretion pathway protein M